MSENESSQLRAIEKLEMQVQQIKDLLNQVQFYVQNQKQQTIDFGPTNEKVHEVSERIRDITTKLDNVERKIPPTAGVIAVGAVILSVLGFGYADLRSINKPIEQAALEVKNSASEVTKSVQSIRGDFESLQKLANTFPSLLDKVNEADSALASIVAQVNHMHLATNPNDSTSNTGNPSQDSPDASISALLGALGNSAPYYMKLLVSAERSLEEGNWEAAIDAAQKAKSLDPNKHAVLYDAMTVKAYFSAENYGQAEIYYKKCIEIEPNEDPFIITSAQYISETL